MYSEAVRVLQIQINAPSASRHCVMHISKTGRRAKRRVELQQRLQLLVLLFIVQWIFWMFSTNLEGNSKFSQVNELTLNYNHACIIIHFSTASNIPKTVLGERYENVSDDSDEDDKNVSNYNTYPREGKPKIEQSICEQHGQRNTRRHGITEK